MESKRYRNGCKKTTLCQYCNQPPGQVNVEGNNAASFTNWNHIVAVYNMKDADGTVGASNLYLNGVLAESQTRITKSIMLFYKPLI